MCSNGIRQTRRIVDAIQRRQHFWWDFFVQLDVAFELADCSTHQHFLFPLINGRRLQILRLRRKVFAIVRERRNTRAL
ncbi:Uncharacterised protein [Shigella sonnei]|nr:Uncharacterised protein [Shigella sonnei]CSP49514.1 Uncharacterised protein [Shigella sonnei]